MKNLKFLLLFFAFTMSCKQEKEAPKPQLNDELKGDLAKVYYDGIWMIPPDYITTLPHFTPEERDVMINNYWGNQGEKRWFATSVDDLTDLYDQSVPKNADKVVLQVSNITNPKKVKAEYMPYDESFIKNVEKTGKPVNTNFYVLDRKFFDGRNPYKGVPNGMRYVNEKGLQTNAITARFGKKINTETNEVKYFVLFQATYTYFFYESSGIGNGGSGGGIQIPIH